MDQFRLFKNTEPEKLRDEMGRFYKCNVAFVETYKDHMIFRLTINNDPSYSDHMVINQFGSVFQVGMDDSKSNGKRSFVNSTDEMARKYIDWTVGIRGEIH